MAVTVEQLRKWYTAPDGSRTDVLNVERLHLETGEHVALLGGSGSGKTTLLHSIAGIVRPDGGRIIFDIDGQTVDVAALREADRDIFRGRNVGYIFQTHHLLGGFSALENVLLGMSFTGRPVDKTRAVHLLEEVGLADRLNYVPSKLSVGQQQRVAVARAMSGQPKLVLADEPTGALDTRNAQAVLDLIRKLCGEVGATLLMVSHDKQIATQLPRVIELRDINTAVTTH